MELNILYEDNHLIVVNKKSSQIVQGDISGDTTLIDVIKNYLKVKYNKPGEVFLGLAHRLDRPVSGAIVYARTSKALSRLNKMFREDEVEKTYWAIVKNTPQIPESELTHYLVRNEKQNKSYAYTEARTGAKEAKLKYKLLLKSDRYSLLEVRLITGRHHQIRCQLAAIGCPIKGDLKYGFDRSNPDASISLHARSISFIHPVTKEKLTIVASVPNDKLWRFFEESITN